MPNGGKSDKEFSQAQQKLAREKQFSKTISKTAAPTSGTTTWHYSRYDQASKGGKVRPPRPAGTDLQIQTRDTDTKGNPVIVDEDTYRQQQATWGPEERKNYMGTSSDSYKGVKKAVDKTSGGKDEFLPSLPSQRRGK